MCILSCCIVTSYKISWLFDCFQCLQLCLRDSSSWKHFRPSCFARFRFTGSVIPDGKKSSVLGRGRITGRFAKRNPSLTIQITLNHLQSFCNQLIEQVHLTSPRLLSSAWFCFMILISRLPFFMLLWGFGKSGVASKCSTGTRIRPVLSVKPGIYW